MSTNVAVNVMAVWDAPFYFYFRDPRVTLSFTLYKRKRPDFDPSKSKQVKPNAECLGTVGYDLTQLLYRERLRDVVDLPVSIPLNGAPGNASSAEYYDHLLTPPYLRVELKVWVLGAPWQETNRRRSVGSVAFGGRKSVFSYFDEEESVASL